MNLKTNYENLLKVKNEIRKLQEIGDYDGTTYAKLNNIANRIELTLNDLRIDIEGEIEDEIG